MSERIELMKSLIKAMTNEEMIELNKWVFECFKASNEEQSWNDVVDEIGLTLRSLNSKPN